MAGHHTLVYLLLITILAINVESRYLPTRANNDRLDKLRELLRDLFESELERAEFQQEMNQQPSYHNSDRKMFFKREVPLKRDLAH